VTLSAPSPGERAVGLSPGALSTGMPRAGRPPSALATLRRAAASARAERRPSRYLRHGQSHADPRADPLAVPRWTRALGQGAVALVLVQDLATFSGKLMLSIPYVALRLNLYS